MLGVAPQHRIRKLRAATKSPEQRVDAQTTASSLTPHSKQRVNSSAGATSADSLMHASHTAWLPRCRSNFDGFLLLFRHIRRASVPGRCHNGATAAGTLQLPSFRGAARGLSLPHAAIRLGVNPSKPRDTDGRCHATPFPRCELYERSTRFGQGPGLSPGSGHEHFLSAREISLPVGGKVTSNATFPRRWTPGGTDKSHHSPLHHTLHCTAAFAAAAGPELPCLFSSWLPAAAAAAALASAPSATAPSEPTKGPAAGYFYYRHRLLLRRHCHHDWPAQRTRQSLVPSFYRCLVFLMERPDQTAAASLLHRTCTVFLGHTQTRVDLRFAPLLL